MKDIAPSPKPRIWFGHREERFVEFRRRYKGELSHNMLVPKLRELGRGQLVTLVCGARDPLNNIADITKLAGRHGWRVDRVWTADKRSFGIFGMTVVPDENWYRG
jgi:hypothetical protein